MNELTINKKLQEIQIIENKMKEFKILAQQEKDLKENLYNSMLENGVKHWETTTGIKIALIEAKPSETKIEKVFDENKFLMENEDLYESYLKDQEIKSNGRKGFIKITLPKE